jgi:tetratricopeptide (TPR) repeat protein
VRKLEQVVMEAADEAAAEGLPDVAIDLYLDVLWFREDDTPVRSAFLGAAAAHLAMAEFDLATITYREAFDISRGPTEKSEVYFNQGRMLSELNWYFPAINRYENSLQELAESPQNEFNQVLSERIRNYLEEAQKGLDIQSTTWPFQYQHDFESHPNVLLEHRLDKSFEAAG